MDFIEGRDLDKVVRTGGPMKVPRAVDCIIQAARGLAAAHERGIIHRDIKPANLLLDNQGTVKVLDLGLARITEEEETWKEGGQGKEGSLTASGIIMGTVDFLSPEQSDDAKRADHRADIYSLGCTLHYLLTGKPPYMADSVMQRIIAHYQKPIPSLLEARPEATPEVDAGLPEDDGQDSRSPAAVDARSRRGPGSRPEVAGRRARGFASSTTRVGDNPARASRRSGLPPRPPRIGKRRQRPRATT